MFDDAELEVLLVKLLILQNRNSAETLVHAGNKTCLIGGDHEYFGAISILGENMHVLDVLIKIFHESVILVTNHKLEVELLL